jgi:aspartyl-tRNA synthetase
LVLVVRLYFTIKLAFLETCVKSYIVNIVKFAPAEVWASVLAKTGAQTGDIIFFGADKTSIIAAARWFGVWFRPFGDVDDGF